MDCESTERGTGLQHVASQLELRADERLEIEDPALLPQVLREGPRGNCGAPAQELDTDTHPKHAEPFQQGEILIEGIRVNDPKTNLPKLRARVGMVFQHFELFPHLRIIDNLCLAQQKVLGRSRSPVHAQASAAATKGAVALITRTSATVVSRNALMKQIVASAEQTAANSPIRPVRRNAARAPTAPSFCTTIQPEMNSPPNRPRQNSMVQTSVSISRVK